ncbi:MAG: hypothetical protein DRR19_11990 [Candidatus Parabeggiatoa sp. nov. 1]|nr:MAG: hypothetical protein DRR19_11990 [Gammaproteobacteria bacterium]
METLKQVAITAISKLPDTAKFHDISAVLDQIKPEIDIATQHETMETVSFLEAAKDYIGSLEGPEDLSTNKAYMKGYGQ